MNISIQKIKTIQYGMQLEAVVGDQRVVLDYYSGSKKKRVVIKPGGDAELSALLQSEMEGLRDRLLASPGPWEFVAGGSSTVSRASAREEHGAVIRIWSDGGSRPNPGPGGYGVVIRYPDGREVELSGYEQKTTNNRMELLGVIRGLEHIQDKKDAVVITVDSSYVMQGMTSWIEGWRQKGWKTAAGKDVLNRDLWETLSALARGRDIKWLWVRGHSGHPENERCDSLATEARRSGQDGERGV